jgi:hypothetical protein
MYIYPNESSLKGFKKGFYKNLKLCLGNNFAAGFLGCIPVVVID